MSEVIRKDSPQRIDSDTNSSTYHEGSGYPKEHIDDNESDGNIPKDFVGQDLERSGESEYEMARYETDATASRTVSRRMTGGDQLLEEAAKSSEPLPTMGGGRDYPPPLADRSPYAVSYEGPDDPEFPQNWPVWKKVMISGTVGLCALSISMGSAMFAEAGPVVLEIYHVGNTVATLGTSLFVFGFASGPVIWGPLSELYGRKPVMVCSCFGYMLFCFAVATAKDIQTIMICRFFGGFIGAAPLVVRSCYKR